MLPMSDPSQQGQKFTLTKIAAGFLGTVSLVGTVLSTWFGYLAMPPEGQQTVQGFAGRLSHVWPILGVASSIALGWAFAWWRMRRKLDALEQQHLEAVSDVRALLDAQDDIHRQQHDDWDTIRTELDQRVAKQHDEIDALQDRLAHTVDGNLLADEVIRLLPLIEDFRATTGETAAEKRRSAFSTLLISIDEVFKKKGLIYYHNFWVPDNKGKLKPLPKKESYPADLVKALQQIADKNKASHLRGFLIDEFDGPCEPGSFVGVQAICVEQSLLGVYVVVTKSHAALSCSKRALELYATMAGMFETASPANQKVIVDPLPIEEGGTA